LTGAKTSDGGKRLKIEIAENGKQQQVV